MKLQTSKSDYWQLTAVTKGNVIFLIFEPGQHICDFKQSPTLAPASGFYYIQWNHMQKGGQKVGKVGGRLSEKKCSNGRERSKRGA